MGEAAETKKHFEDFEVGYCLEYQVPGPTAAEIKDFAARYDPQRFHMDEQAAAETHFGGLVASGIQTQLLCFGPFCRDFLLHAAAVGSPGLTSLKWLRPWYPGERLDVRVDLVEKRLSSKRKDRGYLSFAMMAEVEATPTFAMDWAVIVLTREGGAEGRC